MDKKGETIEVSDLYKKIKITENEISMKKKRHWMNLMKNLQEKNF